MFVIVALVILTADPNHEPHFLQGKTRFATEAMCEASLAPAKEQLEIIFNKIGGAEIEVRCIPTSQHDI